jgi:hypothetical protein
MKRFCSPWGKAMAKSPLRKQSRGDIRAPADAMPPYVEKVHDDRAVRDVQGYLTSVAQPPPFNDIRLLAA